GVVDLGGDIGHRHLLQRPAPAPREVAAARMVHRVVADLVAGRHHLLPRPRIQGDRVGEHEERGAHVETLEQRRRHAGLRRARVVEGDAERAARTVGPDTAELPRLAERVHALTDLALHGADTLSDAHPRADGARQPRGATSAHRIPSWPRRRWWSRARRSVTAPRSGITRAFAPARSSAPTACWARTRSSTPACASATG